LAHKRSNIEIDFEVGSDLSDEIFYYKDMMPSNLKFEIVDKYCNLGNKTENNNELIVYLKPLFQYLNGKGVSVFQLKRSLD
jgi:hypothetical protein